MREATFPHPRPIISSVLRLSFPLERAISPAGMLLALLLEKIEFCDVCENLNLKLKQNYLSPSNCHARLQPALGITNDVFEILAPG